MIILSILGFDSIHLSKFVCRIFNFKLKTIFNILFFLFWLNVHFRKIWFKRKVFYHEIKNGVFTHKIYWLITQKWVKLTKIG